MADITKSETAKLLLKERLDHSEKLWAKSVERRHKMIADDYGSADKMPLFPCVVGPPGAEEDPYHAHPYSIWDFTPASFSAPHEMERVGRLGDGGKWICGMSQYEKTSASKRIVVYSCGIGEESSWENEMLARVAGCEVFGYDHSVQDWARNLEAEKRARAHFFQTGISGAAKVQEEEGGPGFRTIAELMKLNGHEYIDILKVDIEQAEFDALDSLLEAFPDGDLPVGQLIVEVHLVRPIHLLLATPDADWKSSKFYLDWFERLEARGLRPVFTEPNLLITSLASSLPPGHCNTNTTCAEYTFLNVRDSKNVVLGGLRVDKA